MDSDRKKSPTTSRDNDDDDDDVKTLDKKKRAKKDEIISRDTNQCPNMHANPSGWHFPTLISINAPALPSFKLHGYTAGTRSTTTKKHSGYTCTKGTSK